MSEPEGNLWPALAGVLGITCCLGLPLLVAAGVGATLYVLAGIAAAVGAFVAITLVLVRLRKRAAAARQARLDPWRATEPASPSPASPLKRKTE